MNNLIPNNTDGEAIDELIVRFFAVFDNRAGKQVKLSVLDEAFVDGGMIYKRDESGVEAMDLAAFKAPREALFASGALRDFHEWEISHETSVDKGLASRVSHYEKAGLLNSETYQGQGVKHFQLVKIGLGWKITSVIWEDFT